MTHSVKALLLLSHVVRSLLGDIGINSQFIRKLCILVLTPGNIVVCLPNIHSLLCRLVPGGLAESTGLLAVNDEVLEVNGIEVAGKSLDQVRASLRQFRICASVEEVL